MTQTALLKSHPFAKKRAFAPVDIDTLTIASDPLPTHRTVKDQKYEAIFSQLKPGQCIVCESEAASKIGHALNTWLDKKGLRHAVKTTRHYPADGKGRVWLLPPELKRAA